MRREEAPRDPLAEGLLLLSAAFWGGNYSLTKYGISGIDPFVFNALRYGVAFVCLALAFSGGVRWVPVRRKDWGNDLQLPRWRGRGLPLPVSGWSALPATSDSFCRELRF